MEKEGVRSWQTAAGWSLVPLGLFYLTWTAWVNLCPVAHYSPCFMHAPRPS